MINKNKIRQLWLELNEPKSNFVETVTYSDENYPAFQASHFAARFIFPIALEVCKGIGFDIGCGKLEWALPGAIPIDKNLQNHVLKDAYDLPTQVPAIMLDPKLDELQNKSPNTPIAIGQVDYIFSSHCLEHLPNWVQALDYWQTRLKTGGAMFLYLPHPDQKYWKPFNNTKHIHQLTPQVLIEYFTNRGYKNIFCSERDLNHSFAIMAEKTQ